MNKRVLSAEISHETNTFNMLPTTLPMWQARRCYRGPRIAELMTGTQSEISAHLDAAQRYGWDLVQPIAAAAPPGGKTTASLWAEISGAVIDACEQGPFDGVILALHGAMVTEDQDDAEGDLLTRLRAKLGPKVPIAITLDLHANVTDTMAELANIVIAYRTYPHLDHYQRAGEAADLLQRAMQGDIKPRALVTRGPLLEGCDYGRTQGGPMSRLLAKAERFVAQEPDLLAIAICAGFPWVDILQTGPSVTITGNGDSPRFGAITRELMDDIWATRNEKTVPIYSLEEAMSAAREAEAQPEGGSLVLADFSDNPGSGGYGDGVRLLEAMVQADLHNAALACVADRQAVQACLAAGQGAELSLELGAKVDPASYGPPLRLTCRVERLSNGELVADGPMHKGVRFSLGPTAVLRIGGVRVVVSTQNLQVYDQQFFLSQGIDPQECSVVAVKSWHHFRAAFEPMSSRVMLCDSGGLAQMDLTRFNYQKLRRPIWPLDLD